MFKSMFRTSTCAIVLQQQHNTTWSSDTVLYLHLHAYFRTHKHKQHAYFDRLGTVSAYLAFCWNHVESCWVDVFRLYHFSPKSPKPWLAWRIQKHDLFWDCYAGVVVCWCRVEPRCLVWQFTAGLPLWQCRIVSYCKLALGCCLCSLWLPVESPSALYSLY